MLSRLNLLLPMLLVIGCGAEHSRSLAHSTEFQISKRMDSEQSTFSGTWGAMGMDIQSVKYYAPDPHGLEVRIVSYFNGVATTSGKCLFDMGEGESGFDLYVQKRDNEFKLGASTKDSSWTTSSPRFENINLGYRSISNCTLNREDWTQVYILKGSSAENVSYTSPEPVEESIQKHDVVIVFYAKISDPIKTEVASRP
jgi:hypothetical protein